MSASLGAVLVKHGVSFTVISPAGFRILGAIEATARAMRYDLVITSACDGAHSGPNDPHHRGDAYDLRTKTLAPTAKDDVLRLLLLDLCNHSEDIQPVATGFATTLFYAQLEDRGGENEHLHIQLRSGRSYPPGLRTLDPKVSIA